ncbi:hypothetical protein GLYMA_08G328550v4 [Glycine max]|nr:hypothetical protein GLYMA_08G328550v4 [Glycine max]KAH1054255.1 hypothetical protein GYH30_023163 [Glycine max]
MNRMSKFMLLLLAIFHLGSRFENFSVFFSSQVVLFNWDLIMESYKVLLFCYLKMLLVLKCGNRLKLCRQILVC